VIRAIHTAVRGRARYTVPGLYGSEALKRRLEFRLGACEGIQEIAASTYTGNVLVRFQPDLSVEAVAALLGNVLAEHTDALRSRNEAPADAVSANGARPTRPLPAVSASVASRRTIRQGVVQAEEQRQSGHRRQNRRFPRRPGHDSPPRSWGSTRQSRGRGRARRPGGRLSGPDRRCSRHSSRRGLRFDRNNRRWSPGWTRLPGPAPRSSLHICAGGQASRDPP